MDNVFILHLIRHAPTAGNKEKRYIGWTDEPVLPFEGENNPFVRNVWGSDLMRCRQTAKVLFPNAVYHADPDWRECHFGKWERKTYEQLKNCQTYRDWIDDPEETAPPEGESLKQLAIRIDRAVRSLPEGNEFTIVTHGGPVRYLAAKATGHAFNQQTALHGHRYSITWQSRKAYEEGQQCISYSAAPLTANANL
ncbi:alpha-ribazole phosphatase [Planomicrobium koreense]|uniref:Alpha-ribazole phosphatase n=1 Tax=Planococcus koreensis TaxID=112331 RepID=A0A7W8CSP0_9BACL|nr:histidine phosphatase family protein [Planococcus koreensis]MBB5179492.1 alpha-ribazole phosphatase [Planococcus koreensis]